MKRRFSLLLLLVLFSTPSLRAESKAVTLDVDWASFLGRCDPLWNRMPSGYYEGPFAGNGLVGAVLFRDDLSTNSLAFEIGRTDVYDHRQGGNTKYERCRLPIGRALLTPSGTITGSTMRTDLWNAEIRGEITTDKGKINWRCFVPWGGEVIVVETTATGDESATAFTFRPQQGISARGKTRPEEHYAYKPNPPFTTGSENGIDVAVQPLLAGGDYATACKTEDQGGGRKLFVIAVGNLTPREGSARDATDAVKEAFSKGIPSLEKPHREHWHAFYKPSFVTVPDPRIESFYWIQWYKLGSAMRPEGPMVDLMGPWYRDSVWTAYWQNLNTQLALYTVHTGNHADLGDVMCRWIERDRDILVSNCPPQWREDSALLGNPTGLTLSAPGPAKAKGGGYELIELPWLMQHCYLQYRHTMDETRMKESFYPLMRRTFNTYLHLITEGQDGLYHIPNAFSDEYGCAEDTSMNLALLRWGLTTLLEMNARYHLNDPLAPKWKDVLARLTPDPVDENTGIMIGKDTPFSKPHRHYSHLFSIFPLHTLTTENHPEKLQLMEQSIRHFIGLDGDNCMFKFTGASSLFAAIGKGDDALTQLQRALCIQPKGPTVTPNTLYSETGWPTFESPISAARNVLDMLIQSWGDTIRIFPACPSGWRDAAFDDLLAEGAFLVSAKREGGKTIFVRIKSLAGSPCRIRCDIDKTELLKEGKRLPVTAKNGVVELNLRKGEEAVLCKKGANPPLVITPLPVNPAKANAWGLH